MSRTFWIERVERWRPDADEPEILLLHPGLNVLVGEPNTGKTGWLRVIDYCFGDPDPPTASLGSNIADKYVRAAVVLELDGGERVRLERDWGPTSQRTYMRIGDEAVRVAEFSDRFLDLLQIPKVRFPLGNPSNESRWREISWRMMLRHLYRKETLWTDFADQQPDAEQAASVLQLLDLAVDSFPPSSLELVALRRERNTLQGKLEQLQETSRDLAADLLGEENLTIAAIETAAAQLTEARDRLILRRESLVSLRNPEQDTVPDGYEPAASQWSQAIASLAALNSQLRGIRGRRAELVDYHRAVSEEGERIQRTGSAVGALAGLRVTHCPMCDQPVDQSRATLDDCYVCLRPLPVRGLSTSSVDERIALEEAQLKADLGELVRVLADLDREEELVQVELYRAQREAAQAEARLRPYRESAATIVDPAVSSIDREIGFIEGRLDALQHLFALAARSEELLARLESIDAAIEDAPDISSEASENRRAAASLAASAAMSRYMQALSAPDTDPWPYERIAIEFAERRIRATVNERPWRSELGGTLRCYFLLAYHFALLDRAGTTNHPGFVILDFPPNLLPGTAVGPNENFLLEPFLEEFNVPEAVLRQVIAAGRSFADIHDANTVLLTEVWT